MIWLLWLIPLCAAGAWLGHAADRHLDRIPYRDR